MQEEAVARARALGDPRLLASALRVLGFVTEEHETARVVLEESLALARQVGDRRLAALSLDRLGWAAHTQGDEAKAREFLEESVELARAANMKVHLRNALFLLASVLSGAFHDQGSQASDGIPRRLRESWSGLAANLFPAAWCGEEACHDPRRTRPPD
jgi:hypothetical protein